MPYCTQQNLLERFTERELIQLTDDANTGVINSTALDRAIADADGEIDGYLSPRFGAPLPVITKAIERIACDLTRYYLYADRLIEVVETRYNNAVKQLKDIRDGKIDIGITALGEEPAATSDTVLMESGGRVFGRDKNGYI